MPRPFPKGTSPNPAGCPKGAHHVGRPKSKIKLLAKRRSLAIFKRFADIADGKDVEQAVTEAGETIKIPAPVREQIKAGEIVLKVADELGADMQVNMGESSRLIFIHPEGESL